MAQIFLVQVRDISAIAASKSTLINVPRLGRVHSIVLQHGYASGANTVAGAVANIAEVRVKVNNRVQRVASGAQWRDINLLNGTAYDFVGAPNTAPGVSMTMHFAEPWRLSPADQDSLAWDARNFDTFTLEVDLGAASTPTLLCWVAYSTDSLAANAFPGFTTWERPNFGASGTKFDFSGISPGNWIQCINLYEDSGGSNEATQVDVHVDGTLLREATYNANLALLDQYTLTPTASGRTAGMFDVVFDYNGLISAALDARLVKTLTLTIYAGSAMSGSITAMVQRIGNLL